MPPEVTMTPFRVKLQAIKGGIKSSTASQLKAAIIALIDLFDAMEAQRIADFKASVKEMESGS